MIGQIWKKEIEKLMKALMSIKCCAQDVICLYMRFVTRSPGCSSEVNRQKLRDEVKGHENSQEIGNIWVDTFACHEEITSWQGGEFSSRKKSLKESFIGCLKMKRLQPELKKNLKYLANKDLLSSICGLWVLPLACQSLAVSLQELSSVDYFKAKKL